MAKQFLDYAGLEIYHAQAKAYIDAADELAIKAVGLSEDGSKIEFYKTIPTDGQEPDYEVEFPVTDLSDYMKLVADAVQGNIAVFGEDGQVIDSQVALSALATMEYVGEIPEGYEATTVTEYVAEVAQKLEEAGYDDTEIRNLISANASAIEVLNGDADTEGSVAKAVADAQAELEAEIAVKADAATTLEGYGIEDAYTKTETDTAIQTAIAATGHASFTKVDAVPDAADAEENVLYLVENAETGHLDIYALIDGSMEWLDDVEVDLTPYSTTDEMNAAIAEALTEYVKSEDLATTLADYYTKSETYTQAEVDAAIEAAVDEIEAIPDEDIIALFED